MSDKRIPPALAQRLRNIESQLQDMVRQLAHYTNGQERRHEAFLKSVEAAKEATDFDAALFRSAIWGLNADVRRLIGDIDLEYALRQDEEVPARHKAPGLSVSGDGG